MAVEIPGFSYTRIAGEDLSLKQYHGVKINAQGAVIVPTSAGAQDIVGVVQNNPKNTEASTIMRDGISKMVSDGSLAIGEYVSVKAGGKAKQAVTGETAIGIAFEGDGGVDGTIITVLLGNFGKIA